MSNTIEVKKHGRIRKVTLHNMFPVQGVLFVWCTGWMGLGKLTLEKKSDIDAATIQQG